MLIEYNSKNNNDVLINQYFAENIFVLTYMETITTNVECVKLTK